jgi:anthranilate phosphoribosyltransferase
MTQTSGEQALHSAIQKVATGPEYSKDLSFDEAYNTMRYILTGDADPVRSAVLFIGLRMKRETDEENRGILQAILDTARTATADVDELIDLADPYDGFARNLPATTVLPAVFAACGLPAVIHGLEQAGPKFGLTHRHVMQALGGDVNMSPEAAALQVERVGWAYVDQKHYHPGLHDLIDMRRRMIKRGVITTVEVLGKPLQARKRTHFMTGYVHKAYPPVYISLARQAGFDTAIIARGVEGGLVPSLQQPAGMITYSNGGDAITLDLDPADAGIDQANRGVPLSQAGEDDQDLASLARETAQRARAALDGETGPYRDSLVYATAIGLWRTGNTASLKDGADAARKAIDTGQARTVFESGIK